MQQAVPQLRQLRLAGTRLLVVEDDVDLLDCLAECLEAEGASVFKAVSGNEGWRIFLSARPGVVISDLWMPDGTGYDLIQKIRALAPESGGLVPTIATSAAENASAALMAGFHVFVPKPYDWVGFVDTIASFGPRARGAQAVAPWTITTPDAGCIVITFVGRVEPGDMRAMTAALLVFLESGPAEIVSDLRKLTGFTPSVPSMAERAVWPLRSNIAHVRVVGGTFLARLVSVAACKILGIPCSVSDSAGALAALGPVKVGPLR